MAAAHWLLLLLGGEPPGPSEAFDGCAFEPTAFDAAPCVITAPSLAFDGCSFEPTAFDAAPCEVAAAPQGGGSYPRYLYPRKAFTKVPKRLSQLTRDEVQDLYERVVEGKTDDLPKATQKAVQRLSKAISPYTTAKALNDLPEPSQIDWDAVLRDAIAKQTLIDAYNRMRDEEEALVALLLAM